MLRVLIISAIFFIQVKAGWLYELDSHAQYKLFSTLIAEHRCMVCQGQSLADSDALLAQGMKNRIAQLVREGRDKVYIENYLYKRYGEFIRLKPPSHHIMLWYAPGLIITIFVSVICYQIRRRYTIKAN